MSQLKLPEINRVILGGRLTRDPDQRFAADGTPVTSFTLAFHRRFRARDGTFTERLRAYSADMLTDMLDKASLHRLMLRELLGEEDGRVAKELAERVFGDKFESSKVVGGEHCEPLCLPGSA